MNHRKRLDKLDKLTLEAGMLTKILDEVLKSHSHIDGICEISYLAEIIQRKFRQIRALF